MNENTDICNYADDTTPHACDIDIQSLIFRLDHDCLLAIEWFESNCKKLNEDKCHFLLAGSKNLGKQWSKSTRSNYWQKFKIECTPNRAMQEVG